MPTQPTSPKLHDPSQPDLAALRRSLNHTNVARGAAATALGEAIAMGDGIRAQFAGDPHALTDLLTEPSRTGRSEVRAALVYHGDRAEELRRSKTALRHKAAGLSGRIAVAAGSRADPTHRARRSEPSLHGYPVNRRVGPIH